jgi:UDP-glucuronate decarboxylase
MSDKRMLLTWREDIATIVARKLPWDRLSGQCVIVTGAGGFLGGYLTRTLLSLCALGKVERPVQVVAMVRDAEKARAQLADVIDDRNLTLQRCDLSTVVVDDIGSCNYVLHAASQASPRFYGVDPVGTLLPNAVGTAGLLQALRRSPDPRGFLFVSSSEVYGSVSTSDRLAETTYGVVDPTVVRACYAEAKRFGEALCTAWFHQHRVPTYIVRPFHTYGPGLQKNDGRVFADFAFNVVRGENILMNSDGSARRAFCYVSDAVAGFFTVLLKGEPATAYNVANDAADLSLMQFAQLLVSLYPEKNLRVERREIQAGSAYVPSTVDRVLPDTKRLTNLGWRANVDPPTGFRRMIEAYA